MSSKITNCIIITRDKGDERPLADLFVFREDGSCIVNLDGYVIIPVERYGEDLNAEWDKWRDEMYGEGWRSNSPAK